MNSTLYSSEPLCLADTGKSFPRREVKERKNLKSGYTAENVEIIMAKMDIGASAIFLSFSQSVSFPEPPLRFYAALIDRIMRNE